MMAGEAEGKGKILIAIGSSPNSGYLVSWAKRTAEAFGWDLAAVHVDTGVKPSRDDVERLEANLALCRDAGAEAIIQESADIADGVVRAAREIGAIIIVIGRSGLSRGGILPRRLAVSDRIIRDADPIDVAVVQDSDAASGPRPRMRLRGALGPAAFEAAMLALGFAAATGLGLLLSPIIGYRSIALLYLAAVLGLSFVARPLLVFIFAVVSAFILNFLFMEPRYTFRIGTTEDAFLFLTYFLVAIVTGSLVARLGRKDRMLTERERRNAFLLESTLTLAGCRSPGDAAEAAVSLIKRFYQADSVFLVQRGEGLSALRPAGGARLDPGSMAAAGLSCRDRKPAGRGTERERNSPYRFLPVAAGENAVGAVGVAPLRGRPWGRADDNLILSLGRTFAFIVERERLEDARRKAALAVESERISKVLLDSVSHELRTPLTTITGSVSALKDDLVAERRDSREILVDGALEAAGRLNRIVEDILSMSRIESGNLALTRSPTDLSDLANEALAAAGREIDRRRVRVAFDPDSRPAMLDFALVARLIGNLLRNAGRYSEPDSPIELGFVEEGGGLVVSVRDHGPGVPEGEAEAIFERFRRGSGARGGGLGLGLAICRGIALAHEGSIAAANAPDGGLLVKAEFPGCVGEANV